MMRLKCGTFKSKRSRYSHRGTLERRPDQTVVWAMSSLVLLVYE